MIKKVTVIMSDVPADIMKTKNLWCNGEYTMTNCDTIQNLNIPQSHGNFS